MTPQDSSFLLKELDTCCDRSGICPSTNPFFSLQFGNTVFEKAWSLVDSYKFKNDEK